MPLDRMCLSALQLSKRNRWLCQRLVKSNVDVRLKSSPLIAVSTPCKHQNASNSKPSSQ
jgi:hypothetical protein